jgi:hypothetical protein
MLIDRKLLKTTCAALVLAVASGVTYAAENGEDSYYLSQMRSISKSQAGQPEQLPGAAAASNDDLLATGDLEKLSKTEASEETKPTFEKPALPAFKPQL